LASPKRIADAIAVEKMRGLLARMLVKARSDCQIHKHSALTRLSLGSERYVPLASASVLPWQPAL
jgi:hypothetical protein